MKFTDVQRFLMSDQVECYSWVIYELSHARVHSTKEL